MKLRATLATITLSAVALLFVSLPAEAAGKKTISPNDSACNGTLEFCRGMCEAIHINDVEVAPVNKCYEKCEAENKTCRGRDDIAIVAGSLSSSSSNPDIFDPTGQNGGGTGGFDPGSVGSIANAGASAGSGGGGVIY